MKSLVASRLQRLLLGVVCVVCLLLVAAVPSVHASPLYLAKQRAGQMFTYEARRNLGDAYDAMLTDAAYNYPYAFTEDMNNMIRDLFRSATMYPLASSVGRSFDLCTVASGATATVANVAKSGCYKTLLHAGIAGDCVAANPLCCVLYWRYPAGLSDRLPSNAIDPQLIFWDGSKAVNGFYTNFSLSYRATYSSCAALPTWPAGNTAADGVALSMDADGEWRFTRRRQPVLSFVEHHITSPTGAQASEYAALDAAGAPQWGRKGQFGSLPIIAPIVVCAVLLLASLVLLLITYCCTEPPARKEKEELQLRIEILETTTAEQESEINRRRTRSEPRSSQSTRGDIAQQQQKESPSPVDFRRSSSGFPPQPSQLAGSMRMGVTPSPSPQRQQQVQPCDGGHVFSPASQPQSGRATPTALSRRGSQSQLMMENAMTPPLQQAMGSGRRASITPDHRRPAKRDGQGTPQPTVSGNGSFAGRASTRQSPRTGSFTGQQQARQLSRNGSFAASSTSPSPASRQFSQNFQNPLLGRQTFK